MSKYSAIVNGKREIFTIKKPLVNGLRYVYLGDRAIGFLSKISKSWTACYIGKINNIGVIRGFRTMWDGVAFIDHMRQIHEEVINV